MRLPRITRMDSHLSGSRAITRVASDDRPPTARREPRVTGAGSVKRHVIVAAPACLLNERRRTTDLRRPACNSWFRARGPCRKLATRSSVPRAAAASDTLHLARCPAHGEQIVEVEKEQASEVAGFSIASVQLSASIREHLHRKQSHALAFQRDATNTARYFADASRQWTERNAVCHRCTKTQTDMSRPRRRLFHFTANDDRSEPGMPPAGARSDTKIWWQNVNK